MGPKDLLVHVDASAAALVRLRLGADLASRHGARLIALYAREWTEEQRHERSVAEMGLVSYKQMHRLNRRIEALIDSESAPLRSMLEALGREYGVTTEWRCLAGSASDLVAQHARYADLCIVGHDAAAADGPDHYSFSEKLLFLTGRPVLFIPPVAPRETLGSRIVVAWNSSRAAARAVHDALPLMERAEWTMVITVNPADFIDRRGALPVERMIENLERHGVSTELVRIDGVPKSSIADVIQAKAHEFAADLLVAGAFGHPRLWEKLFGGVTRDLLDRMSLPVLMSC